MRLIIGISGASGVVMGQRLLLELKQHPEVETHLILTEGALKNFEVETTLRIEEIEKLADFVHGNQNLAAPVSSGSYETDGMIIIPCSMKTLSGIAHGFASNLIIRAADVCLKENRKVVLVPREMPLSSLHLHNLERAAHYGCTIIPPMLTFYNDLATTEEQVHHILGKVLMQFGLKATGFSPWEGRLDARCDAGPAGDENDDSF